MKSQSTISTKKIVITALLAALTFVGSAIRITIPIDIGGTTSFHLGNILCALSGLLMGPWYGGLSAAIGSALYDMTNPIYIADSWITFLSKGTFGLVTGLTAWYGFHLPHGTTSKKGSQYIKITVSAASGAIVYGLLYLAKAYLKSRIVQGVAPNAAILTVIAKTPNTIFNAIVAIIFAPILMTAIETALRKSNLNI